MQWNRTGRDIWRLETDSLQGEARVEEVEGGFHAVLRVQDRDFGMILADTEEFYESRKMAKKELKEQMKDFRK